MDKRIKEKYNKALKFYTAGNLNKALEMCEECMAETLKCAPVLNLKGLIFYQQGKLEAAVAVWKINREVNDDNLAKNYIKDAKADEARLESYLEAEKLLKELNITEALCILLKCTESDFNCIRVNTGIAICYLKKGEYKLCKKYIEKVLEIDKNYKVINDVKKELAIVYKDVDKTINNKKIVGIVLASSITLGAFLTGVNLINGEKKVEIDEKKNMIQNEEVIKSEETPKKKFNGEKLAKEIKNKDFDQIHNSINEIEKNDLDSSNLKVYEEGLKLLKKDGAISFYGLGQEHYSKKEFENAKEELNKAILYGKDIYIYEHIIYYLGLTEEALKNNEKAIEAFSEYESEFSEGVYIEEVLYRLALLNDKEGNLDLAKKYAKRLKRNFKESIYNNTNMSNIIEK